jgi:hypothetical protein
MKEIASYSGLAGCTTLDSKICRSSSATRIEAVSPDRLKRENHNAKKYNKSVLFFNIA